MGKKQEKNVEKIINGKPLPSLPPRPPKKPEPINQNVDENKKELSSFEDDLKKNKESNNSLIESKEINDEKRQKNNSKNKSKKLFIILSICLVLILALVIFGICLGIHIKNGQKLSLPTNCNLEVVEINDKTYLMFDKVEVADKYIFKISAGEEQVEIISEKNIVDVTAYFNQNKDFKISVSIQGKSEKSRSEQSKLYTYDGKVKLNSPAIFYHAQNNQIIFEKVDNASEYEVYCIKDNQVDCFDVAASDSIIKIDCPTNGNYFVFVVAKNSLKELTSKASNLVQIGCYDNQTPLLTLQQDILNVNLSYLCDFIEIKIDENIYLYKPQTLENQIDLKLFNVQFTGVNIGVRLVYEGAKSQWFFV